jgi:putative ABC transport system ATP-binding protein
MSINHPAIELDNVYKQFGHGDLVVPVLRGISLTVPAGELALIMGPSGCGKTTLLTIIAGLLAVDKGSVTLFGQRISHMSDAQKTAFRKHHIGFIFQQFNLLPTLTARENVAVPLIIQKVPRVTALARADAILEQVGMGDRLDFLPANLSGGQQQRIAIARALVLNPKLVVCDEPTAALDHQTGQTVMQLLVNVATQPDRCVLVVTHDNRIFPYGNRVIEMDDGCVMNVTEQHPAVPAALPH